MEMTQAECMAEEINLLASKCYSASKKTGWWDNLDVADPIVVGAKLALVHSEISEALKGARKDLMDDHLPHRKMVEVELADAVIMIANLAGALGLDLGGAVVEKMAYNAQREDHKREVCAGKFGKKI